MRSIPISAVLLVKCKFATQLQLAFTEIKAPPHPIEFTYFFLKSCPTLFLDYIGQLTPREWQYFFKIYDEKFFFSKNYYYICIVMG